MISFINFFIILYAMVTNELHIVNFRRTPMPRIPISLSSLVLFAFVFATPIHADRLDDLMKTVAHEVSGNRAHDYTARIWQYDKWSTLPMWKKSSEEIRDIMLERRFDEAKLFTKPADGRTKVAT